MNRNFLSTALSLTSIKALTSALLLACSAGLIHADADALTPYRAHYQISHDGLSTMAERILERDGDHWRLSQHAKLFFFKVDEESKLEVHKGTLRPLSYRYENNVSSKKNLELTFDWAKQTVSDKQAKKPWQKALKPHFSDQLSAQLQLREMLIKGQLDSQQNQTVVKRKGKLKTYGISRIGEERIETAMGTLQTVKLRKHRDGSSSETFIWLAPELNYLIVKLEQREDDELYSMNLLSAEFDTPSR